LTAFSRRGDISIDRETKSPSESYGIDEGRGE
jgi:hypothetical protein